MVRKHLWHKSITEQGGQNLQRRKVMDEKLIVAKVILKLPLTPEEHAFYNLYLAGREKDILKGMV